MKKKIVFVLILLLLLGVGLGFLLSSCSSADTKETTSFTIPHEITERADKRI